MKLNFLITNPTYREVKVVFDFGKHECIQAHTYDGQDDITRKDQKFIINANYFFSNAKAQFFLHYTGFLEDIGT